MANPERRTIIASFLTGITDLAFAVVAVQTGFADWYWNVFHLFGVVGFGMFSYAMWHAVLYKIETGGQIWAKN